MKPRVRVKAPSRYLAAGVPVNARPGDLVLGNRGAGARVIERWTSQRLYCTLALDYIGNFGMGVVHWPSERRVYDFRGIVERWAMSQATPWVRE